jgi:azurin
VVGYGQELVWTGQTPFEIKTITSKPDGFEVAFTLPVDAATAGDPASYSLNSFTYKYHHTYGSPIINAEPLAIRGIVVAADGLSARLVVDETKLRKGYIHEVKAEGVKSAKGLPLLHNVGYYTLNEIGGGQKADAARFTASSSNAMPAMDHSQHSVSEAMPMAPSAKRVTTQPATWTNGPDQVITIGTKPGLKFDLAEIQVKAGSKVKFVFNNNDDMLHNCVITLPGAANKVGETALNLGLKGAEMNYIPDMKEVLYHTGLMQPESSEALYFVAPAKAGDYQYVCTFPGHHTLMQGKMKVVK